MSFVLLNFSNCEKKVQLTYEISGCLHSLTNVWWLVVKHNRTNGIGIFFFQIPSEKAALRIEENGFKIDDITNCYF